MNPAPLAPAASSRAALAARFLALHAQGGFVIPNPWDVGSARLLANLGFKALASTSSGLAFSHGLLDNTVSRELLLGHLTAIAAATPLPVNADLESGFGATPEAVAETFRLAGETGIVGASIEDSTGQPDEPLYPVAVATERVRAAIEAVRRLPFPFTFTARAENFYVGRPDLADTIRRLQAYQEAGADVLYAPGIASRDDIATILASIDRPLNVLIGVPGMTLTVPELIDLGVRRISVGGSFARAAYGALLRAARELQSVGSTGYAATAVSGKEISALLAKDPFATGS